MTKAHLTPNQRRAMFAKRFIENRGGDKFPVSSTQERFGSSKITSPMQRAVAAEARKDFQRDQMIRAVRDPESFSFPQGHPSHNAAARYRLELQKEATRRGFQG